MPEPKSTPAQAESNGATGPIDADGRARARIRRGVMAAMAKGDYALARFHLHRWRPMTPDLVLRWASIELRVSARARVGEKLFRRAMRVVEAVWLAVRRGDGRALAAPDKWAGAYLEGQREDERISGIMLLDKPDVWNVLVSQARRMREYIDEWSARKLVTADDAAHFVETFMPGIVSSVAPEITGHGVLDAKVAEEARAAIFREYKRAWEKGNRLDDEGLARLVLRAFSDSNVAGSYGKAHAMRRSRLKRHRAASR